MSNMKNQTQIPLLRSSYWIGAIIDGFVAIQLLLPNFWASFDGLSQYTPNATLNFALDIASALMLGWTFLLIWADRKPVERKGVLLLTAFPVIFGLALNNISAIVSGLRSFQSTFPELILQMGLAFLFIFSYLNGRRTTA
jgi:hypothetical protein